MASAVLAGVTAREGSGGRRLDGGGVGALLEALEELADGLRGQVLVVFVVDLDHGGVDAGAEAFYLDESEETVSGGLALLDAKLLLDGLDDDVGTASTQLAGSLQRWLVKPEIVCGFVG